MPPLKLLAVGLACLVPFMVRGGPVHAQEQGVAAGTIASPRTDDFQRLIRFVQRAHPDDGERARQTLLAAGRITPQEDRFVQAIIAARANRLEAAEVQLRSLLVEDSGLRLVRLELVRVLMGQRRYSAARFHLDQLQASEPDARLQNFYNAIDRQISTLRPWDAHFSINAAPSTNINDGSSERFIQVGDLQFEIDERSRARSGVGLDYQGGLTRRFLLTPDLTLIAGLSSSGTVYRDGDLTHVQAGANTRLRRMLSPRSFVEAGIDATHVWSGNAPFSWRTGGTLAYLAPLSDRVSLYTSASLTHVDHIEDGRPDGWQTSVHAQLSLSPQAGRRYAVFATASDRNAGYTHDRSQRFEAGLSVYREMPWSITAQASVSGGVEVFKDLFPGQIFAREDWFYRASVSALKKDWAVQGFAPSVTLTYEANHSNVSLKQNDALGVSVGLSRTF